MIPKIKTDRLILAPPTAEDFEAFARLWTLPEVYHYILGSPRPKAQSWAAFLGLFGCWAHLGYGMWLLKRRDTGVMIGQVGFLSALRGHGAGFDEYPEAGWLFEASGQGQGYAHEAMTAALGWFDGAGRADRCVCMIDPANAASMRLADKLGFAKTRLSPYEDTQLQLFERQNAAQL